MDGAFDEWIVIDVSDIPSHVAPALDSTDVYLDTESEVAAPALLYASTFRVYCVLAARPDSLVDVSPEAALAMVTFAASSILNPASFVELSVQV